MPAIANYWEHPALLCWFYVSEALLRVRKSKAVLDMGTGGEQVGDHNDNGIRELLSAPNVSVNGDGLGGHYGELA